MALSSATIHVSIELGLVHGALTITLRLRAAPSERVNMRISSTRSTTNASEATENLCGQSSDRVYLRNYPDEDRAHSTSPINQRSLSHTEAERWAWFPDRGRIYPENACQLIS